MIHEIAPDYIDNQYKALEPDDDSKICIFDGGKALLHANEDASQIAWPRYKEVKDYIKGDCRYLFSISEDPYFLARVKDIDEIPEEDDYTWIHWVSVRDVEPKKEAFAAMTAYHLSSWYTSVRYCGRCGKKAEHDEKERMMRCPKCGNMMFPKISPAIIAAVIDKEHNKILVTKYTQSKGFALVAGFVEIGETMEECVAREVYEETGVHVKNIRYYDDQPWGFAGNLMIGYTAELDGDAEITLDENELAVGKWMSPEELPEVPEMSSLTRTMIHRFKEGTLKF